MAQTHKKPPCEDCENRRPILLSENWEAWELWLTVNTQWRTNMGQRTGLDYSSLYLLAGTLEIEITPIMLTKIRALEKAVLEKEGGEK